MNISRLTKIFVPLVLTAFLSACGGEADVPEIDEDFVEAALNDGSTEKLAIICDECVDLQDADNEHLLVFITNTETGERLETEIDEMGNFSAQIEGTLEQDIEMHIEDFEGDNSANAVVVTMIETELFETETVDFQDRPRISQE